MLCSYAMKLGQGELEEIAALEKDLGTFVLAFACQPLEPATLSPDQLQRVRAIEDKLGVVLVAARAA